MISRKFYVVLAISQIVTIFFVVILWSRTGSLREQVSRLEGASGSTHREPLQTRVHGCRKDKTWCHLDFTRLEVLSNEVHAASIWILGYMAIDNGVLTLYENEDAYLRAQNERSIEIRGTRSELEDLFKKHGYKYVRIEGKFGAGPESQRSSKIGVLHSPFRVVDVPIRSRREGVNDISVHVSYAPREEVR